MPFHFLKLTFKWIVKEPEIITPTWEESYPIIFLWQWYLHSYHALPELPSTESSHTLSQCPRHGRDICVETWPVLLVLVARHRIEWYTSHFKAGYIVRSSLCNLQGNKVQYSKWTIKNTMMIPNLIRLLRRLRQQMISLHHQRNSLIFNQLAWEVKPY